MLKVVDNQGLKEEATTGLTLDELAREGARRMLAAALEMEVAQYIENHAGALDVARHWLVVRNARGGRERSHLGRGRWKSVRLG